MRGILADINVGAQRDALLSIWASDDWRDLWNDLGLIVESFPRLGLPFDASDALIWRTCQHEEVIVSKDNRAMAGALGTGIFILTERAPRSQRVRVGRTERAIPLHLPP
jgi:hypothetical protein